VDLGAEIIDFDVLAREVVEPDQPAWRDITAFFGEQVLQDDRRIDRKKLSAIVFGDLEKRKKLESFTHPRISELFLVQLNEITARHPRPIVLAVIPLLIEVGMQALFHKLLMVHVPPETQVQRLMIRDGITKAEAEQILAAQMPIDEKRGYADFVIGNQGSLDDSRRQAADLWEKLKAIQGNPA
jgi:dephospho-CoA kinase